MTDFIFKNEAEVRKFGKKYFKEYGNIKNVTITNLPFFIYLIAYLIFIGESISPEVLKLFKLKALQANTSIKLRIFFEKVEDGGNDILYFLKVVKEIEKQPNFQMTYGKYVEGAA